MFLYTNAHDLNQKRKGEEEERSKEMDMEVSKRRRSHVTIVLSFIAMAVSCILLYQSANPLLFLSTSTPTHHVSPGERDMVHRLEQVLGRAAMEDKTVILTTLNDAWAEAGSVFDLFLESFRIGNQTQRLLNHLVVIAMDQKAYDRCVQIHPHCFAADPRGVNYAGGEAYYMTPDYLQMMWARVDLLASVLRSGYNFLFTDADIMWLRNPFPRLIPDADFQIACDHYLGDSFDLKNQPNGGFNMVRSNNRTIRFYKFWYNARTSFPGMHDQDVLNKIKFDPFITNNIGMQIRFLDTNYFAGFCEPSRDFNLVCTMHANCCFGLDNKVNDLKLVLRDWTRFKQHSQSVWSVPNKCSIKVYNPPKQAKKKEIKRAMSNNS